MTSETTQLKQQDLAAIAKLTEAYRKIRAEMAKAIVGQEEVLEERTAVRILMVQRLPEFDFILLEEERILGDISDLHDAGEGREPSCEPGLSSQQMGRPYQEKKTAKHTAHWCGPFVMVVDIRPLPLSLSTLRQGLDGHDPCSVEILLPSVFCIVGVAGAM